MVIANQCEKCELLLELYGQTPKSPRCYWVMTELFCHLHGSDVCDFGKEKSMESEYLIDCQGCPCLNSDYEQGCDCNLGYHTQYGKLSDGNWHQFSEDCGLTGIRYKGGSIGVKFLRIVTPLTKVDS